MTFFVRCLAANRCPLSKPFRCANGECKTFPSGGGESGCTPETVCPEMAPIKCHSGECAASASLCRASTCTSSDLSCPADKPVRCEDLRCVTTVTECDYGTRRRSLNGLNSLSRAQNLLLPSASDYAFPASMCSAAVPTLCEASGTCASSAAACSSNGGGETATSCPLRQPYRCVSGECVGSPADCVVEELVQDIDGSLQCKDASKPYLCSDGTCAETLVGCPVLRECPAQRPVRCSSGHCEASGSDCKTVLPCSNSTVHRCSDGICRKQCIGFTGCDSSAPVLCGTGHCAASLDACVMGCDPLEDGSTTYRCADATCKPSLSLCTARLSSTVAKDVTYTLSAESSETEIPLVVRKGEHVVKAFIPSGALVMSVPSHSLTSETDTSTVALMVRPVPESMVRKWRNLVDDSRLIQFGSALDYESSVLSPVAHMILPRTVRTPFRYPVKLRFKTDILDGVHKSTDLCLATVVGASDLQDGQDKDSLAAPRWNCIDRQLKNDTESGYFTGRIAKGGIYAVILSPRPLSHSGEVPADILDTQTFFEKYQTVILISLGVLCVLASFLSYVFWRLYRYRIKYKMALQHTDELEDRIENMEIELQTVDLMSNPLHEGVDDIGDEKMDINVGGEIRSVEFVRNDLRQDTASAEAKKAKRQAKTAKRALEVAREDVKRMNSKLLAQE